MTTASAANTLFTSPLCKRVTINGATAPWDRIALGGENCSYLSHIYSYLGIIYCLDRQTFVFPHSVAADLSSCCFSLCNPSERRRGEKFAAFILLSITAKDINILDVNTAWLCPAHRVMHVCNMTSGASACGKVRLGCQKKMAESF